MWYTNFAFSQSKNYWSKRHLSMDSQYLCSSVKLAFFMPSFQNCFPSYSARSQCWRSNSAAALCLDSYLCLFSVLWLFWHYLLLSLLLFITFYLACFSPFFHLCLLRFLWLSCLYWFFSFCENLCCNFFTDHLKPYRFVSIFPICSLFSYSKKS